MSRAPWPDRFRRRPVPHLVGGGPPTRVPPVVVATVDVACRAVTAGAGHEAAAAGAGEGW